MNTWTRQKGYPVLMLTKESNTSTSSTSSSGYSECYRVTQERFLMDPLAYSAPDEQSPYDYKWEVPVTYITSNNATVQQVWLHQKDAFIDM